MSSETKNCQNCKQDFTIEPDDFSFYEKIKVPPPTFCSECRKMRRWAWRNNMSLYSRKCQNCDKSVVSLYSSESGLTIYCNKCWWSDSWDAKEYGVDYNFSKPFFSQFRELLQKVPQITVVNDDGIASLNCEYTHDWWFSKNCYMCFTGWKVENVMYSYHINAGKDIMDSMTLLNKNDWVYECFRASTSYKIKFCWYAKSCLDSVFLYNCTNCSNCFMCTNLKNKKYYFKNQEYSKEEYGKILESYRLDTFSGLEKAKQEFEEFRSHSFYKYVMEIYNVNCTGDNLSHSKNSRDCFAGKNLENCRYLDYCVSDKDSYDLTASSELAECYEGVVVDHSQLNLFGLFSVKSQDIQYSQHCHNCKYIFGCIGLKNASYCIFNKQYTKEEYEDLLPKIIEQMNEIPYLCKNGTVYRYGEFFPVELSPFGYNESYAPELIPIEREEAIEKGYQWQDRTQKTIGKETILPESIPDSIRNIENSILEEVLKCIDCSRDYKIIPNELIFYRQMNLPVPRRCLYCRYQDRIKKRNPLKLWHRTCMCENNTHDHTGMCVNEFETVYAPERPEVIYCSSCFQKEMV